MSRVKSPPLEPDESRYLNRELSWLQFNERVLEEAANPQNPLLERLKFLAIFESNLDEFYMVRVSGLIEQFESGVLEVTPDGLSPNEQLESISEVVPALRNRAGQIYANDLRPQLDKAGVRILRYDEISEKQRKDLDSYFQREVFPLCTPVILFPTNSVPFISNRSLNIAVELSDGDKDVRLGRIKVPTVVPRATKLSGRKSEFVLLEDIIGNNLQAFFPGVQIHGWHMFRVIRDADIEIKELEAADLITTIEQTIKLRRFGDPVLLEYDERTPTHVVQRLRTILKLDKEDTLSINGLVDLSAFWEIAKVDKPSLRFRPHIPHFAPHLASSKDIFEATSQGDVLLHHPFDSFRTVEEFVASAASDPNVVGVKQTLYRVGSESPIVESLLHAAESGKQVAVMVELKARFDESNNIGWARALEQAGVHVTYGFQELKTHCKLCLVVRREGTGIKQYAHIGTGNYNPATARLYTDLGLLTCDEDITQDISELFNYLTGFSKQASYRKLLVAPVNLREGILDRIRREEKLAKSGQEARIIFKANALVDPEVIDALYAASNAGTKIDLIVRGICCLRPGVKGQSENIRVISIVGRFLEHSRVFYYHNGGKPELYFGSADCMRRNLDRRIEVLTPVESPRLISHILEHILESCLKDTVKGWQLDSEGRYSRVNPGDKPPFSSQDWLVAHPTTEVLLPKKRRRV